MDESAQSELLAAAGGGAAPELARQLMLQAAGAELAGDPLAAMLAVQMAAVHEAATVSHLPLRAEIAGCSCAH